MKDNPIAGFVQLDEEANTQICVNINHIKMFFANKGSDDCLIRFPDNSYINANMSFDELKYAIQMAGGVIV